MFQVSTLPVFHASYPSYFQSSKLLFLQVSIKASGAPSFQASSHPSFQSSMFSVFQVSILLLSAKLHGNQIQFFTFNKIKTPIRPFISVSFFYQSTFSSIFYKWNFILLKNLKINQTTNIRHRYKLIRQGGRLKPDLFDQTGDIDTKGCLTWFMVIYLGVCLHYLHRNVCVQQKAE